jgi:hypothetical protein
LSSLFNLRFGPGRIRALASAVELADDAEVIQAGKRIASGDHTLENLRVIVEWKSARAAARLMRNREDDVADALRLAILAGSDRAAIAVLTGLRGVDVPVASAIMWAIAPARFTTIDYRTLESLGVKPVSPTVEFYLGYLEYCRRVAAEHAVSLRELERALGQWSKERRSA